MEYTKESIIALKQTIKELSSQQKSLRNQRKTVNLKGERKIPHQQAQSTYLNNSDTLAHMFIAYAIMRGKQPQPFKNKVLSNYTLTKILEKYAKIVRA